MNNSIRPRVEVLKFCTPRDVLLSLACTSAQWRDLAELEEVWEELCAPFAPLAESSVSQLRGKQRYKDLLTLAHRHFVPVLEVDKSLSLYNPYDRSFVIRRSVLPRHCIDLLSAAVPLPSGREILICGGRKTTNSYLILARAGACGVAECEDLIQRRTFHAAIAVGDEVMAFGGENQVVLRSAESFNLSAKKWKQLPDMHSLRCSFNACRVDHWVYLCGGISTDCERFDPTSHQYSLLPYRLSESNWSLSFVRSGRLTVVTGNTWHSFGSGGSSQCAGALSFTMYPSHSLPSAVPLPLHNKLYITSFVRSAVIEVSLDSLTERLIT